jgi:SAM-dependent methyltransferase
LFDVGFLNTLREAEFDLIRTQLRSCSRILEFGAGTGAQARTLFNCGFEVVAIDLCASAYSDARVFPVMDYDGRRIPLPDSSVDIVYSSNVLEHVEDLPTIMSEFRRVLRSDGYCVHLMPSVAWRIWTFLAGPPTAIAAAGRVFVDLAKPPKGKSRGEAVVGDLKTALGAILPIGHGTSLEGVSELWTFSTASWRCVFEKNGFLVERCWPVGLFHTGHMLLGPRISIRGRQKLSNALGSAANAFIVRPT